MDVPVSPEHLLTVGEAANFAGVSEKTIYRALDARRLRHARIGQGTIGEESFRFLMTSPLTRHLPKYLETPDGPDCWKKEIALLRNFAQE